MRRLLLPLCALALSACATSKGARGGEEATLEAQNRKLAQALPQKRAEARRTYDDATRAEGGAGLAAASCTFVAPSGSALSPASGAAYGKLVLDRSTFLLVPRLQGSRNARGLRQWPAQCQVVKR